VSRQQPTKLRSTPAVSEYRSARGAISRGPRRRGFTLIEVLVALAIVTIGMAAVLGALTSSANTTAYMRDKTFAQWVALNQIALLRISGQMTPTGNSDGDTDFAGRTWHWRREVTATQVPGVVRIDVKVRPAEIKGDDDNGWFTTVSGIQGDAVGVPNGYLPDWGVQTLPGLSPTGQTGGKLGAPGTIGSGGIGAPGTIGSGGIGAPGSGSGGIGVQGGLGSPPPPPPPGPTTDPDSGQ
jgi:general secretion pathway protein I